MSNPPTNQPTDTYAIVRARLANGLRIADADVVHLCEEIDRLRSEVESYQDQLLEMVSNMEPAP